MQHSIQKDKLSQAEKDHEELMVAKLKTEKHEIAGLNEILFEEKKVGNAITKEACQIVVKEGKPMLKRIS